MKRITFRLVCVGVLSLLASCQTAKHSDSDDWGGPVNVRKSDLASRGRNDYFVLEPGYQMTFEGTEDGHKSELVITVLDHTRQIDGVETRIVEERESTGGDLKEVSQNFFAIDSKTHDVYYFGEEVDIYQHGKVVKHEGAWESGKNGARYGLFMPAHPHPRQKFYQERAPGTAMDRCEVWHIDAKQDVPAGHFQNCLVINETSPLEPDHHERKIYGPGAGLLIDGDLKLVKYGVIHR